MKYLMCWFLILSLPVYGSYAQIAYAQTVAQATPSMESTFPDNRAEIEEHHQSLLAEMGRNGRYEAAAQTLDAYECSEQEYIAKLYLILAEEAVLTQDFSLAAHYYQLILDINFKPDYYTEGLVAIQARIKALAGQRNIALAQKEYAKALDYHQSYEDSLTVHYPLMAKRLRLDIDKTYATCYQRLGRSEKALHYLMPYAFGSASNMYSSIDKEAIDHLTSLLRSKYPKKPYKEFLRTIDQHIHSRREGNRVKFYLQVLNNELTFQNDGANFERRAAQDERLIGAGVAHYQRKLLNSYFYQSLLKAL